MAERAKDQRGSPREYRHVNRQQTRFSIEKTSDSGRSCELRKNNGLMFMEASALESTNVEKAYQSLIHNIFDGLSRKLTTKDDKKVEIMKGQVIQISAPLNCETKNKRLNTPHLHHKPLARFMYKYIQFIVV
ncbi:hypothetical protein [Parasitella parasitica]|uniref:Uncharacterized protein n=1 Tax=Parasitella parasitica TaxID=35722 RepID=A0A0B7NFM6_9FUNG|nr:hypothetical protein [Parasitella parasitica]